MLTSCGGGRSSPITVAPIPAGMRGIDVLLRQGNPTVAPGDHVDLLVTDKGQTLALAENWEVASVDRGRSEKRPPIVHFFVSPDDASRFEESLRLSDWYAPISVRIVSAKTQSIADN